MFPFAKRAFAIRLLVLVLGCGAGVSCAPAVGADSGGSGPPVLRLYTWEDYMSADVVRRFEARHGVRVELETYGSTEELLGNLERKPGHYDVIFPSSYTVAYLRSKAALAPLDKRNIPNAENLDPRFRSPTHDPGSRYCMAYLWSKLVLGYNAGKVRREPRTWGDMFAARHAGRVALLSDTRESMGVVLLMLGYSPNTTDPDEIARARDFLRSRSRHIRTYADDSAERLLAAGEVDMILGWEGDMVALASRRPDLRYAVPVEGSLIVTDSMCIPKTSRNKLLAERFIDFVLDAEVGAQLSRELLYPTPNLAARARLTPGAQVRSSVEQDGHDLLFPLVDVGTTTLSLYEAAWAKVLADHRRVRHARR